MNLLKCITKIKGIKAYYFTDVNQKEYMIINREVNQIVKSTVNEKMEYYYYVSANPNDQYP